MVTLCKKQGTFLFFIMLAGLSNCKKEPEVKLEQNITLNSLTKLNDYPFYTLKYNGDYGFRNFLKTGIWPSFYAYSVSDESEFQCTCIAAMGSDTCKRFGRNFDWYTDCALLLFTNPSDGYASVSMVLMDKMGYTSTSTPEIPDNNYNLLRSPYYSLDGMNEKGVAIGLMAVEKAYPPYDENKTDLYSAQVIRLVLDYASNVAEAINLIKNYNLIFDGVTPVHFLIADKSGFSAVVEFMENEVKVINTNENWQICTNFIQSNTNEFNSANHWRYNKAYKALEDESGNISSDKAMDIMRYTSQEATMWSVVYDLINLQTIVTTDRNYSTKYIFDNIYDPFYTINNEPDLACNLPNVALNKAATSSSVENSSLAPQFAFDGNMETRWSSNWNQPEWIKIDLEKTFTISGVTLFWENACAIEYNIEVSVDDNEWTEVYYTDSSFGSTECISFDPVPARYVRLHGLNRWTIYGFSLWEFEVHEQ